MQELTQHGMARLQQNLIDVIKEAQAKVGYRKGSDSAVLSASHDQSLF